MMSLRFGYTHSLEYLQFSVKGQSAVYISSLLEEIVVAFRESSTVKLDVTTATALVFVRSTLFSYTLHDVLSPHVFLHLRKVPVSPITGDSLDPNRSISLIPTRFLREREREMQ
jgi:hypothetical protein